MFTEEFTFQFPEDAIEEARQNDLMLKSFAIYGTALGIEKAEDSKQLIIHGECSNAERDMDGEVVMTKGINLGYAQKEGKVIWGHTPPGGVLDPEYVLGVPLELKPFRKALYIKAQLNPGNRHAVQVFNLMKGMPGNHGIGWSIEGGSLLKKGHTIVKSWLKNISLYHNVKNLATWSDIVKAHTTGTIGALRPEQLDDTLTRQVYPSALSNENVRTKYFKKNQSGGWIFKDFSCGMKFFKEVHGLSDEAALDQLREIKKLNGSR